MCTVQRMLSLWSCVMACRSLECCTVNCVLTPCTMHLAGPSNTAPSLNSGDSTPLTYITSLSPALHFYHSCHKPPSQPQYLDSPRWGVYFARTKVQLAYCRHGGG
ncbi:hypothetical protein EDC01DRAFT_25646 [Geopyxis carbonaria]|nr:hypothetical protein EDC01DRAFT_25646 [Geopyxis carbonaria]